MDAAFDILVSALRYFFLAILLYILVSLVFRSIVEYGRIRNARDQAEENSIHSIQFLAPSVLVGEIVELEEKNTIGSDEKCDICIENSSLMPVHATILERNGIFYLRTKLKKHAEINGSPVHGSEAALHIGDTVWIREICFRLERERLDDLELEEEVLSDGSETEES